VAVFLGTVDGSIVNIALPTIVDDFDTSFGAVQWVPLSYLLTQATLVLGMGRLGDIAGRKAMFVTGFAVFTIGSVLSGLSPSVEWLILFRVVSGIGSALIFSMQFALITEAFPPSERGKALGINGTIVSTGIISGPIIGGLIIDAVDWRWIFYVNLPIGIIGILAALRYIPHTKPGGGERFDFKGGALFFVGLLTLLLSLTTGQERGFTDTFVIALYAVAVLSLIGFVMLENRTAHPMLDLHMFRSRDFSISLFARFATFTAMAGISLVLPFYLTDVMGLAPRGVGFAMTALPVAMGVTAPLAGAWSDRNGVRRVAMGGLYLMVIAFVVAWLVLGADTPIWAFVVSALLFGLAFGIFQSPNNSAVMGAVPSERLGVASSLITITRITGWITGIAVMGTIWAVRTVSYAGGGAAADAPAAAQASGLTDVLIVSLAVVVGVTLLSWRVWRGRWDTAITAGRRREPSPRG
jgi:EmrB/QacA subfamily drug resistance transporter